jgi:[protein-PII] uridylyltransferase
MDTLTPAAPFDPTAARIELTGVYQAAGSALAARPAVIRRLKQLLADARARAEAQLVANGRGRLCAASLSDFEDELVRLVFDYTTTHVYRATNPSEAERMGVIATGGYGRGLLAPGSDIDLLFLLPYKQTAWGESVAEYMLYVLWDLGQKVGHATRTIEQSIKLALTDHTIRTTLLDARWVAGDQTLAGELITRFAADIAKRPARDFIDAKMSERDMRHRRTGESRYLVEPNVKDGKGGLRDLHTLHWLAKYLHGSDIAGGIDTAGVLSAAETATFHRCEDFLWTVRCHLHFLAGRAEERLSFDLQTAMSERLRYRSRGGLSAVERFMKHYFLIAKEVGDLTRVVSSTLEEQQLKSSPRLSSLLNPLSWTIRRQVRRMTDFKIENDRLNIVDAGVFDRDPLNMLRYFARAEETGAFMHPEALRRMRHSLHLIDDTVRNDRDANRIFLDLLTAANGQEGALRRMNEAGVLGRFVPEFGHIVSMMQFNMYHHYTVDEHLLRTVGELSAAEDGRLSAELPVSTKLFKDLQNRRVVFVAAFLHDIAKGQLEDHSILGARIARRLCPRFGLDDAETETVVWLVEQHLTMSMVAQNRDLADPKTIRDFAAVVQTSERLKLLLLLTVADIRAVGPGVWNGWKGQLLRTLYAETNLVITGGGAERARPERVRHAKDELRQGLADWSDADVTAFAERQYPDYFLKIETRRQVEHARLMREAEAAGKTLATSFTTDRFTAITELTVLAPNHPRVLALFAGACAASGANIVGAHISTTRHGFALDTFLLQRALDNDDDEARRARRIGDVIERLLKGEVRLKTLMEKRRNPEHRIAAFKVPPELSITNTLSDRFTVLEVAGIDRPGLLYELTNTLSDLSLDIESAHITTYGEKAVDVFYLTDLTGRKIEAPTRIEAIKSRLLPILAG